MKHAAWARDAFYPLCRQFLLQKAMESKKFPHRFEGSLFIPVISVTATEDENHQQENSRLLAQMTPALLPQFEQALWQAWGGVAKVAK